MEPVSTGALAMSTLKVISQVMDFFPNYDQRKRKQYVELLRQYEQQKILPFDHPDYSDDILANIRIELFKHGQSLNAYLLSEGKESKILASMPE